MPSNKETLLGMNPSTAMGRLRKQIMYKLASELNMLTCCRCYEKIENAENFSVDHVKPWMQSTTPKETFWDLNNIAFSHLSCNTKEAIRWNTGLRSPCGTRAAYKHGCRCTPCKKANSEHSQKYRATRKDKKNP